MRPGSSHVHVLTAKPGGMRAADQRGSSTIGSHGCSAACPAAAVRATTSRVERLDEPRRAHARQDAPADGDRLEAERGDQPPRTAAATGEHRAHAMGEPLGRVEVGVGGIVLDLDVDEHARAGVERGVEARDVIGQLAGARGADRRGRRRDGRRGGPRAGRRRCGARRARRRRHRARRAAAKAAIVFSGSTADAPRWAMIEVTTGDVGRSVVALGHLKNRCEVRRSI